MMKSHALERRALAQIVVPHLQCEGEIETSRAIGIA